MGRRTFSAALTNAAQLRSRAGARIVGEALDSEIVGSDVLANRDCVYQPLGSRNLGNTRSSGGWISTPVDLVRIAREYVEGRKYLPVIELRRAA